VFLWKLKKLKNLQDPKKHKTGEQDQDTKIRGLTATDSGILAMHTAWKKLETPGRPLIRVSLGISTQIHIEQGFWICTS